jgi:hypothetical protein
MTFYRYEVRQEGPRDWRVWLVSELTGDRKDCVAEFTTKSEAHKERNRLTHLQEGRD